MPLTKTSIYRAVPLLLISATAAAHHSSAPHYDREKLVEVQGVVTEWKFVNPHAYVYFDVTDSNGDVSNWRCESDAATSLQRRGWTDQTFLAGQELTVKGISARREKNVCSLDSVVFPDGTKLDRRADLSRAALLTGIITAPPLPYTAENDNNRALTLANGQPNISGVWVAPPRRRAGGAMGGPMSEIESTGIPPNRGDPSRTPEPTAAGLAAGEEWDYSFDNPALFCKNTNIIRGWRHDRHVNEITQTNTSVTLTYGYMDDLVRTVHLDVTEHSAQLTPSTAGHSIGWWEGDTLVVDTVGFSPGVFEPFDGIMHSDEMHVVERFLYNPETRNLVRSYTVTDPLYFKAPVNGQDTMQISAVPHQAYGCVELSGKNNQRAEN